MQEVGWHSEGRGIQSACSVQACISCVGRVTCSTQPDKNISKISSGNIIFIF